MSWEQRMAERSRARASARSGQVVDEPESPNPSREQVLAELGPGIDAEHCSHGIRYGHGGLPPGIAVAAPLAFCECCLSHYTYIDSGIYALAADGSTAAGGSSTDKHLCGKCGGQVREWGSAAPVTRRGRMRA